LALIYRAKRNEIIRRRVPADIPRMVGKEIPASGRVGSVGAGVEVDPPPWLQTQSVSVGQLGFLQYPW